jgi:hypothetical protein
MNIGIIDTDLECKQDHNFPNLALMKISGYHKSLGDRVTLSNFGAIAPHNLRQHEFDKIYISKVFTDSKSPDFIAEMPEVAFGGTGFFYDKAPRLPNEIEHHFPDYHLYDVWMKTELSKGRRSKDYFKYYTDFSIGFTTRGCFRQCEFCVNKNEKKVVPHSPLVEFIDPERKKICLLDDNVLGCGEHWERIVRELQATGQYFQFKQGLDIRLLTDKKAKLLTDSKYEGNYIFAFDDIADRDLIEEKLTIWNKHSKRDNPSAVLYCFTCFDRSGRYDKEFWLQDLIDLLERMKILMKHKSRPYVMRFERHVDNPHAKMVQLISSYCNSGRMFQKMSLNEYSKISSFDIGKGYTAFKREYPEIAKEYFYLKFNEGDRITTKEKTIHDTI